MCAYAATNAKGGENHLLRWRFSDQQLIVETVSTSDGKEVAEKLAEFDWAVRPHDKAAALDLAFRPGGFEGMCKDEKGQKVLRIFRRDEKLEVVLDFSGTPARHPSNPTSRRERIVAKNCYLISPVNHCRQMINPLRRGVWHTEPMRPLLRRED
jgi:hypothetical protein